MVTFPADPDNWAKLNQLSYWMHHRCSYAVVNNNNIKKPLHTVQDKVGIFLDN